jgi:hypothetical protein
VIYESHSGQMEDYVSLEPQMQLDADEASVAVALIGGS